MKYYSRLLKNGWETVFLTFGIIGLNIPLSLKIQLSERVQRIKPSPTLAVTAKAAQLKREGREIIGLGAGEPDFDTPTHIKQAAIAAINDGFTKYTAVDGIPGLKQAIIAKFARDNNLTYAANQVLVSCGGKQSFYNLAQALLNSGDEVIIPAPYWVSYPDMVRLADADPVFIYAGIEQGFKITPAQLRAAITPRTRLLVINSPSNPTGVTYSHAELAALGAVLRDYPQILIANDDMYEHIVWGDSPFCNILNACPDLYERTIMLNGVSKAYAMTGWRIGYAAGPAPLIEAMTNIQSQSTSNPCSISQAAGIFKLFSSTTKLGTFSSPRFLAFASISANFSTGTIGFLKKEPTLREFGSVSSITIDLAARICKTASRVSLSEGFRAPKNCRKSL